MGRKKKGAGWGWGWGITERGRYEVMEWG